LIPKSASHRLFQPHPQVERIVLFLKGSLHEQQQSKEKQ